MNSCRAAVPTPLPVSEDFGGVIVVGSHRQLLFDDFFMSRGCLNPSCYGDRPRFADWLHGIKWCVGRTEKSPHPLLEADRPWESGVYWNCVIRDGGKFRMWYFSHDPVIVPKASYVCYAESDDGASWRKPDVNLVKWNDSSRNNIVFTGLPETRSMELGNVFIDPSAKPDERYKMIYTAFEGGTLDPVGKTKFIGASGVLRGAYSPDGLHWTVYNEKFQPSYSDTQNSATYDPVLGKYVAYTRARSLYGGIHAGDDAVADVVRGRSVGRIESSDYRHWTSSEIVVAPDFYDGLTVDLYNPSYSPYPAAQRSHFLFPSAMEQYEGRVMVDVAVSRDNVHFMRPVRQAFIVPGEPTSFDSMGIYASPGIVSLDNAHCALYSRSDTTPHGGIHYDPDQVHPPKVGRAVFKRDRIIGIESSGQGAFSTRTLVFDGRRLVLNVEPIGPDAQVSVEILPSDQEQPVQGYAFQDCLPLSNDELDGEIRWKSGADLGQWAGKPVRLRVSMNAARLYAFQFLT